MSVHGCEEETMGKKISLRLTGEMLERVGKLVERLRADPVLAAAGTVTPSTVLRLALAAGLAELEGKRQAKSRAA